VTTRITVRDTGELRPLAGLRFNMTAGIHEQEASQPHGNSGLTVGEIAMVNEFGSGNIPARKWMRKWAQQQVRTVAAEIRDALVPMAKKLDYSNPGALRVVAQRMKSTMRGMVLGGLITPANSARTLARKAPEDRPLVETKQLVNSAEAAVTSAQTGWNYNTR
jgi:hypothetical protein